MANYFRTSPWQQDVADLGHGVINSIAQMLFQVPAIAAQQRQQQEMLSLRQREVADESRVNTARIGTLGAQQGLFVEEAGLASSKNKALQQETGARSLVGDFAADVMESAEVGDSVRLRHALRGLFSSLGRISKSDRDGLVEDSIKMYEASHDPTMRRLIATGGKPFEEVSNQGTLVDVVSGKPVAQGGFTLPPQGIRFPGVSEGMTPLSIGTNPSTQAPRGITDSLLMYLTDPSRSVGFGTNVQARARQIIGERLQSGGIQGLNPTRTQTTMTNATATGLTAPPGKVKVRNRDGVIGFIPASQLEEAFKEGYVRVE